MSLSSEQHDLPWLKESLQAAIELELSTLPPYLCALWSIKDTEEAYSLVRSVVLEEMLHLGLVCNMLAALEEEPILASNIPTYPGHLPGHVRPQLTVYLAGFSKDYLEKVCMQIEYPESGPVAAAPALAARSETYVTIGAFYDAILAAFQNLNPPLNSKNQLDGATLNGYPLYPVTTLADVEKAIKEIQEQGEGTSTSPDAVDFPGKEDEQELAHYYKFAQIFYGKSLEQQSDNSWKYTGDPIAFPEAYPMAPVPPGGYVNPSQDVKDRLDAFNSKFSDMLEKLESAWAKGSEDDLSAGIGIMFELKEIAVALMNIPLPDNSGVYGPDFLLASSSGTIENEAE